MLTMPNELKENWVNSMRTRNVNCYFYPIHTTVSLRKRALFNWNPNHRKIHFLVITGVSLTLLHVNKRILIVFEPLFVILLTMCHTPSTHSRIVVNKILTHIWHIVKAYPSEVHVLMNVCSWHGSYHRKWVPETYPTYFQNPKHCRVSDGAWIVPSITLPQPNSAGIISRMVAASVAVYARRGDWLRALAASMAVGVSPAISTWMADTPNLPSVSRLISKQNITSDQSDNRSSVIVISH